MILIGGHLHSRPILGHHRHPQLTTNLILAGHSINIEEESTAAAQSRPTMEIKFDEGKQRKVALRKVCYDTMEHKAAA